MKIKILILIGFLFIGGCAVYAPPYAGYGYGVAPIVPVPVLGFGGWGRGFRR